jgi:hypothetical protein
MSGGVNHARVSFVTMYDIQKRSLNILPESEDFERIHFSEKVSQNGGPPATALKPPFGRPGHGGSRFVQQEAMPLC